MEETNGSYKWNNIINIQLLTALFYVFSGSVMARRTENKIDNVAIFVIFTGAIILGLLGYGESFSEIKKNNQVLVTITFLSLAIWSHMDVLKDQRPNTYNNIVVD